MIQIELHPAFVWDCDECGRQNFERAIIPPFQSKADEEYVRQILDITPEEGFPVMAPFNVSCRKCEARFETDVTQIYGDNDGA